MNGAAVLAGVRRSGWGWVGSCAAVLFALAILLLRPQLARGSHADRGSSYRSSGSGLRALYLLLSELGFRTSRLQRAPYLDDPRSQLVSAGEGEWLSTPRRRESEARALASFVERGGRLVLFSLEPPAALLEAFFPEPKKPKGRRRKEAPAEAFLGDPDEGASDGVNWHPRDPAGRAVELRRIVFLKSLPKEAVPLLTAGRRIAGFRLARGRGEFVFVGSPDCAENEFLERGENVEFVLSLLDPGRPVVFDEYRHGYDEEETIPGLLSRYGLRLLPLQLILLFAILALRSSGGGSPADRPRETVDRGAREDLVRATARLARRSVSERDAVSAYVDLFRTRLRDPSIPALSAEDARRKLDRIAASSPGLVEIHRSIREIEACWEKKR